MRTFAFLLFAFFLGAILFDQAAATAEARCGRFGFFRNRGHRQPVRHLFHRLHDRRSCSADANGNEQGPERLRVMPVEERDDVRLVVADCGCDGGLCECGPACQCGR